jgi:hypothetical protein
VRAPNAGEVFGSATHVLASFKVKILYDNTIFKIEPRFFLKVPFDETSAKVWWQHQR